MALSFEGRGEQEEWNILEPISLGATLGTGIAWTIGSAGRGWHQVIFCTPDLWELLFGRTAGSVCALALKSGCSSPSYFLSVGFGAIPCCFEG